MDVILVGEGIPFVSDPDTITLVRVKLYKRVPFPFLEFIKIFLETCLIWWE